MMIDLSAGPEAWAHKVNEPDTSRQYPDPEAIRQKHIAELEREITEVKEWPDCAERITRLRDLRSELSRLRNEQPKGGDAIDRKAEAAAARHEVNKGKPWPTERLINDLVAAGESEYAPSPSPEPQDAREALNRAIRSVEALYLCGYTGNILLDNLYIVQAALAQSDAQPVGAVCRYVSQGGLQGDWVSCCMDDHRRPVKGYEYGFIYTAPPRPDASGLIEAAEVLRIVDEALVEAKEISTRDPEAGTVAIWLEGVRKHIDQLRSRAADRSAPRSDKGGA